MSLRSDKMERV